MEWDRGKCLELIRLFENKPQLWQTGHKYLYSKSKKNEAWEEIAAEMKVPREQIKAKLNSLLASHRRELLRERTSRELGQDDVYNSKWFAYEAMRFIKEKIMKKQTLSSSCHASPNSLQKANSHVEDTDGLATADGLVTSDGLATGDKSDMEGELFMDETLDSKTLLISPQRNNVIFPAATLNEEHFLQPHPTELPKESPSTDRLSHVDPNYNVFQRSNDRTASDIYGEHIAMKLKTYDKKTQALVQHYINNIVFQADMGTLQLPVPHPPMP
ncbi:uncharacterized protein LOC108676287 [Hyalella azteca]|uniref:Uncharacterized protein LOC108676287 n=1 Tax=Hyalella azteca TaxID=294128 RepID=A0A8B7P1E7_HYAAZ|nr:uncharacterized protein LOC108676287 [Hyalella azteca]